MPKILEAPASYQEESWQQEHEDTLSMPPVELPHTPKHSSILAALKGLVASRTTRHRRPEWRPLTGVQQPEAPLDMLARHYPDLYIRALTG